MRVPGAAVQELARRVGIVDEYVDMLGRPQRTSTDTCLALLAAMGIDAADEGAARRSLDERVHVERSRLVEPVAVVRESDPAATIVRLRLPEGISPRNCGFGLALQIEGEERRAPSELRPRVGGGKATLRLPHSLGSGYHAIQVTVSTPRGDLTALQTRIVHPPSCAQLLSPAAERKAFGLWANLYSLRSEKNFGVGDLGDLQSLCAWATELGAVYVGINPTSSTSNHGFDISPYSPLSRLYHNEIYLDVTAVPEFAGCDAARDMVSTGSCQQQLRKLRTSEHVDYEAVMTIKRRVLDLLFESFVKQSRAGQTERGLGYRNYVRTQGVPLHQYATYRAISEHLAAGGIPPADWRAWPAQYRDPSSREVREFQQRFADAIEFHMWVQFELDCQMRKTIGAARPALPIGVCADLPLAPGPGGADTWSWRGLFATGAHIGAPPDDFADAGQDWGLSPVTPHVLRESRYEYWIGVVNSALRHAGALRIDHVMGLFRQFWIPAGQPGCCGAYVRYPAKDLLGILALESARNRALIFGEDLGTVPAGLQSRLARWGILSTRVLYFERDKRGSFRPSRRYSKRALVTAHTHDQVPLAGFWNGRDLQLRRDIGALGQGADYNRALAQRDRERSAIATALRKEGALVGDANALQPQASAVAVYDFLARTPAPLLGVSLDDLGGETDPVNIPGVPADRFPTWSRRMSVGLEELPRHPTACAILEAVVRHRGAP